VREDEQVLRGYRTKEGELPTALNGFLYSCLRSTRAQRRAILQNFLRQFDDSAHIELAMKLYLADNLAYIPYTVIGRAKQYTLVTLPSSVVDPDPHPLVSRDLSPDLGPDLSIILL